MVYEIVMFILKGILRAESQEKILIYLLVRERGYGKAIAEFFDCPPNPIQKQLFRLEKEGVLVSHSLGRMREYQLNPRYAFYTPLKNLLKATLQAYPGKLRNALAMERRRPRAAGKTVRRAEAR
jgi:predicted transcriptional regulator